MKRLLCIVGGMNAGGAETFLMKIYRNLDKTKYQMDFAVGTPEEGYYDAEIQAMGGKLYHIVPKSQGLLKNFVSLKNIVRDNHYDYVLRTSQQSLSALELFAAKLGGASTRIFRSSNTNSTSGSKTEAIIHKAFSFMPKVFPNVKIAPSTMAAEYMFGKGCVEKGKAKLLKNSVDLNVFAYDAAGRQAVRRELGIAEDTWVIGHVGRFNQQKNHKFLLDIFQNILKTNPNSRLLLVGKGELEEAIRQKAKDLNLTDKIIFTGVRKDIPQLLSAMDVFVFPSFYEGMPNTVIEAQATGLGCVIADTITPEADITGLVDYVSLDTPAQGWAQLALAKAVQPRADTHKAFIDNGYDIDSATKQFVELVFGDKIT